MRIVLVALAGFTLSVALSLFGARYADQHNDVPQLDLFLYKGVITANDPATHVIMLDVPSTFLGVGDVPVRLSYDDSTLWMLGKYALSGGDTLYAQKQPLPAHAADARVGSFVMVNANRGTDGLLHARLILIKQPSV